MTLESSLFASENTRWQTTSICLPRYLPVGHGLFRVLVDGQIDSRSKAILTFPSENSFHGNDGDQVVVAEDAWVARTPMVIGHPWTTRFREILRSARMPMSIMRARSRVHT